MSSNRWTHPLIVAALALGMPAAAAAELSRNDALKALAEADPAQRRAAVERLADIGRMSDAERVLPALRDSDPAVRESAAAALWAIWSRSGDAATDALLARGVAQMAASAFDDALATFDAIVRLRPAFAEGWNKRATIYFLLGRFDESLKDVDEVLKRNRHHFGALSGAGQIHLQLGHERQALDFFRRALDINPNLHGVEAVIPVLEERLRRRGRNAV
jgi:tetratricopeptide (TPR) repeat protein